MCREPLLLPAEHGKSNRAPRATTTSAQGSVLKLHSAVLLPSLLTRPTSLDLIEGLKVGNDAGDESKPCGADISIRWEDCDIISEIGVKLRSGSDYSLVQICIMMDITLSILIF